MNINRAEAKRIVEMVAELADIASLRDIDAAEMVLGQVARALKVDPETVAIYRELRSL